MPPTNNQPRSILKSVSFDAIRSPLEIYKQHTSRIITSLHDSQQTVLSSYVDKIATLLQSKTRTEDSLLRLENEEKLPRSIRFKYELTGSKTFTDTDEFKHLQATSKNILDEASKALKAEMITCKKQEAKHLHFLFVQTIYNACAILVTLIAKEKNQATDRLYHGFRRIIRTNEFLNIEQHIDQAKRPSLFSEVCIPIPDNHVDDFTAPLTELEQYIQTLITTLFIDSYKAYNNCIAENKQHAELQKLAKLHLSERKAEDIAMVVDNEPSVNPDLLNKLINDKVAELLAKEIKKINIDKNKNTKSTQNSNSQANTSDNKRNNNNNNNNNKANKNRQNNNRTNDSPKSNTDNTTPKNNQRGAQSAPSTKKSNNPHGDRNNASPKRKREESNNSSRKTKRNNNRNSNEKSTK
jgi:hypothetical protein